MRIGELAELGGVTPRTIRYYENLGLLGPSDRAGKGFRYYSEVELARLQKIDTFKRLGMSLEEIKEVIDFYFADAVSMLQGKQKLLEIMRRHLREADDKIRDLQHFRAELLEKIARTEQYIKENS